MSDPTTRERVAIVDLADDLQVRKQRIFKVLRRLGIRPTQRREPSRGNQNVATVTASEASTIQAEIGKSLITPGADGSLPVAGPTIYYSDDVGFFYLIQLEPRHDPGRFKVGFTTDLEGRLQKHRCAAPFAQYVCSFPSKRVWERAAIDCVTNGCERLHTEVFRSERLEEVASRAKAFFSMMPSLEVELQDDRADQESEAAKEVS